MFVFCVCCMLCRLQPHRPADHSLGSLVPDVCDNGEADSARFGPWCHREKNCYTTRHLITRTDKKRLNSAFSRDFF